MDVARLRNLPTTLRANIEFLERVEGLILWQDATSQAQIKRAADDALGEIAALRYRLERLSEIAERPSRTDTGQTTAEYALIAGAACLAAPALWALIGLLAVWMTDNGSTPVEEYPPPHTYVQTTEPEPLCVLPTQQEREACARALFGP